jgi:FkbM family methyltransferase
VATKQKIKPLMNHQKPKQFSRAALQEYLPTDPIIIEAGAHVGRDTVKMAQAWPAGTIYAFEPVPHLYEQLVANTKDFANIHCYQTALSTHKGTATFYVSSEQCNTLSSLLIPHEIARDKPDVTFVPIEVETTTLDIFIAKHNLSRIDFMWLDLQGYELAVLKASQHALDITHALLLEVSLTERYKDNPLYPEINTWLQAQQFELCIEHLHHRTWGNAFYIRKK